MKRHIIQILILFGIVCAINFFLLNSNWLFLRTIPPTVAPYLKPRALRSFQIGQQRYRFPGTLVLSNVRFSLEQGWTDIDFSIDKLIIYNFLDTMKMPRKVRVDVLGLKMQGKD